ncbi:MAG TPA: peptidoglycan DD-metalloendopeptidase family protein [Candidatus Binatia bacterium]
MEGISRRAITFWLSLSVVPLVLHAATIDKDLEGLKKKIERERQGISQVQKKEGSVLQTLGKIESELDKKSKLLEAANVRLSAVASEMRQKQAEAESIKISMARRQELFRNRVTALYRWYRGGTPFILFNGGPSLGSFLLRKHYLESTLAFDRVLIAQLSEQTQQRDRLAKTLALKKEELDGQRQVLAEAQESVRKEAQNKKILLASLRQEKESRIRAVKELEQAALRLQKMMEEISRRAVSKPPDIRSGVGLGALRGKLDWPVKGELISGFGKARHREVEAEVFHNGIDIEAPIGEEVKAVEKGTVVFADRFSGYGKMVIVDHGNRYYTIYAHLSEILKRNGDAVSRGEALGRAGDSDSLSGAKLYFEMRKDGRSIDPVPWFAKR